MKLTKNAKKSTKRPTKKSAKKVTKVLKNFSSMKVQKIKYEREYEQGCGCG
jgi:hypothetical protein